EIVLSVHLRDDGPDTPFEHSAEDIAEYVHGGLTHSHILQQAGLAEELIRTDTLFVVSRLHVIAGTVTTNSEGNPTRGTQLQRDDLHAGACRCVTGFRTDIDYLHVRRGGRTHLVDQHASDIMVGTHRIGCEQFDSPGHVLRDTGPDEFLQRRFRRVRTACR